MTFDETIEEAIKEDLTTNYKFTADEADEFISVYAYSIIDSMWNEYSFILDLYVKELRQDD